MTPEVATQVNHFLWIHLGELLCILVALIVGLWFALKIIKRLNTLEIRPCAYIPDPQLLDTIKQTRDLCQQILQKVQTPPSPPAEGVAHIEIPIGPVSEQR